MRSRRLPLAPRALLFVLAPLSILFARPALAVVAQITSIPAANQSWGLPGSGSSIEADVFWVRNPITVTSAFTLTWKPGIIVKFDPGVYLNVNGALEAVASGASPISITSSRDDTKGGDTNGDLSVTSPAPSDWNGIYLYSHTSPDSSRFAFCDIAYGGSGNNGMINFMSVSGALVNCTLRRSYIGVMAYGTATPLLVDTNIQNSTVTPLAIEPTANPTLNRFAFSSLNNGYDAIGVRSTTLSSGTATLPKRAATVGVTAISNVTYVLLGGLTINPGATLTLSPGVVMKMAPGAAIGVYGTLTMNGTISDTISVTSASDDGLGQPPDTNDNGSITSPHPGDWGNIVYYPGSSGSLQYCRVKFGSNSLSSGMIEAFNVNLSISNSLLSDAAHGFTFHGTSAPTISTVTFANMTSCPTLMSLTCNPNFSNLTFVTNGITALGLIGEPVSGALHLSPRNVATFTNITYYVMNGFLEVNVGSSLIIDPGIVIKFPISGNVGLIIDGVLTANGTVSAPIVFTSERDNVWGNPPDTNGDAGGSSPVAGNWAYIRFTSTSTASVMNYCRIECGSQGPYDGYSCNLWISSCAPTISNCNINHAAYGIRVDGPATPTLGAADTVTNCISAPIAMSAMADPTFTQPFFKLNGINGLALISETLTQSATIRYRPQVTFQAPDPPTVYAYVTTGTITVPAGLLLAIQPQVVLKVYSGNPAFSIAGTLNAVGVGSGASRIIFTSFRDDATAGDTNADGSATSPAAGNWSTAFSITQTAGVASVMRNCLFTFGGSGGPGGAAVMVTGSSPRIVSSDFLFNPSALIFYGASKSVVDSCGILNCTNIPITMSLLSDPTFLHLIWSGNPYSVLGLVGETITQDVRLATRTLGPGVLTNIAYSPIGNIAIGSAAKWTINPGITLKLGRYAYDPTGLYIAIDGALIANGKPDSLIVFTSMADDAFGGDSNGDGASSQALSGQWQGIAFSALTNVAATVMNNVRIRYSGAFSYQALSLTNTGFPISNTDITAGWEGIGIAGTSTPTLTNVNVDSCGYFPVRMSLVSNPVFTNVNFRRNSYTGIGVVNETIAQDLLWKIRPISGRQNMPYLVDGTVGVGLGSTMTIQPGLIVKFRAGNGAGITVNRAFFAQGKSEPESLIVLTSSRDDFYGGRSDSTASTTAPAAGDWYSVLVQNTAIVGQVKFKNCAFRYGGSGFSGALRCASASPSVDSCLFAYNATGVSVEGSANPIIHGSSFFGHTSDAVYNSGTSFCVDATGCWWGDNNGPNDSNAAADVCGPGQTHAGLGDAVTNNVNYSGFASTGLLSPLIGDVSLNGVVRAYDASLILQSLVGLISLTDLQMLVADVSGVGGVSALDATMILQYVAGIIPAFPAVDNGAEPAAPDLEAARALLARSRGDFEVTLGAVRRSGEGWEVPVLARGSGTLYALEMKLDDAAAFTQVALPDGSPLLESHHLVDGRAVVALAARDPVAPGEIAVLRFSGSAEVAPQLTWARVNETVVLDRGPAGPTEPPARPQVVPDLAFFAAPAPNPASGPASLRLGISIAEAGGPAAVRVVDIVGRTVRILASSPLSAGVHTITWDLRDDAGRRVSPGLYFIHARAGRLDTARRLIVVR